MKRALFLSTAIGSAQYSWVRYSSLRRFGSTEPPILNCQNHHRGYNFNKIQKKNHEEVLRLWRRHHKSINKESQEETKQEQGKYLSEQLWTGQGKVQSTWKKMHSLKKMRTVNKRHFWKTKEKFWKTMGHFCHSLLWARSSLTFRQLWSVDSLWNAYVTWQEHTDKVACLN